MRSKVIKVDKVGTLMDIMKESLKDISRKKIKSMLKYKMVEVNGKIVTNGSMTLYQNDTVEVFFDKKEIPKMNLEIIYEDQDLIVINKPAGLLSISNSREKEITAFRMVSDYVKQSNKGEKIFVVHRLDQGTSGVLMFAKNLVLKEKLQSSWNDIVRMRQYIAVVEGVVLGDGTIESYLTMNKVQKVHSTKNQDIGWYARTNYKSLKVKNGMTLLEVCIDTGRRNQIRVHMSEAGHPIVGDKKYGAKSNSIGRLALHASKLWIVDPRDGKLLRLESCLPETIKKIID